MLDRLVCLRDEVAANGDLHVSEGIEDAMIIILNAIYKEAEKKNKGKYIKYISIQTHYSSPYMVKC